MKKPANLMLWEAHITVTDEDVERWCAFCSRFNARNAAGMEVKPLYIELSAGEHLRQLMFAARWEGQAEHGRVALDSLEDRVRDEEDFEVLRAKLECPLDKAHGLVGTDSSYAECHMKLMLPPNAVDLVDMACSHANVHASRNLLAEQNGLQKWYLTKRDYGSNIQAAASFNDALALVREVTPAVRMEMEYVVYDSNPELDKGWV